MGWFTEKFHRAGSPRYFYRGSGNWIYGCYLVGGLLFVIGSVWGLWFVPPDRLQGEVFRIIYMHVPAAHLSQLIYFSVAVAGGVYVIWRMKMADVYMQAAVTLGAILTALALFSGYVWGMPTWGTGWVWDARTTSVLVQLFLFLGLLSLRELIPNDHRATMAVSILAIVGVINIPIIKYSVDWFTTLHQPASIQIGRPIAIASEMLWPLAVNSLGMYVLVAGIILARMRNGVLNREQNADWVRTLVGKDSSTRDFD